MFPGLPVPYCAFVAGDIAVEKLQIKITRYGTVIGVLYYINGSSRGIRQIDNNGIMT